jgi:uncharacterized protein
MACHAWATAQAVIFVLQPQQLIVCAVMTFAAAYIRGLTGFGMAIILVPLLGMIIRPDEAVMLAILLQLLIGPVGLKIILADAHKASALRIAACAVAATPIGLMLLARTSPDIARVVIAGIAIAAFLLVILTRKSIAQPGSAVTIGVGLLSGVLTGFAAMPGPPVIPYYLREAFSPQVARASMMLVFFATAIAGTISALLLGVASARTVMLSLFLFIPMLAGNALGARAFGTISPFIWRSGVACLLGIAALSACWRALL